MGVRGECVLVVGSTCGVCVDVQLASMCGSCSGQYVWCVRGCAGKYVWVVGGGEG